MIRFASDEVAAMAKDPIAAAALAAREKLDEAFAAQDIDTVSGLCANDLIVNSPANRVARREAVLGFFRAGRMNYDSGRTVSRRYTDVWRRESDGQWRLTVRQATITSVA